MTRRLLAILLILVTALACAGFVRLNRVPVALDLLVAPVQASVGLALVLACLVGWLVGTAGALGWIVGLARERSRLARALRLAEGELRTLRATQPGHAR